jgi:hypothetical protein
MVQKSSLSNPGPKPTGLKGGALLPKEPAASLCDFCDFSFGRVFVNNNSTGF